MPMKSYKAKKSKNPRGIVIGVLKVLGSFRHYYIEGVIKTIFV